MVVTRNDWIIILNIVVQGVVIYVMNWLIDVVRSLVWHNVRIRMRVRDYRIHMRVRDHRRIHMRVRELRIQRRIWMLGRDHRRFYMRINILIRDNRPLWNCLCSISSCRNNGS